MITFEKLNDLQAFINYNDVRIGVLEKTIGGYLVELNYKQHFYPENLKPRLKDHIEKIYKYSKGWLSLGELLRK